MSLQCMKQSAQNVGVFWKTQEITGITRMCVAAGLGPSMRNWGEQPGPGLSWGSEGSELGSGSCGDRVGIRSLLPHREPVQAKGEEGACLPLLTLVCF